MGSREQRLHSVTMGNSQSRSEQEVGDIDPRELDGDLKATGPVEELEEIQIDVQKPERTLRIGKELDPTLRRDLLDFLRQNLEVFAWTHSNMVGINPEIMAHRLNIDPSFKPVRQKKRAMNAERYVALKEEVEKLLANGFIRESYYPDWLANPVLVKKNNGK